MDWSIRNSKKKNSPGIQYYAFTIPKRQPSCTPMRACMDWERFYCRRMGAHSICRAVNKSEANYHSFELEMLAIVRVVERFHIYLYGIHNSNRLQCSGLCDKQSQLKSKNCEMDAHATKLYFQSHSPFKETYGTCRCIEQIGHDRRISFARKIIRISTITRYAKRDRA